MRIDRVSSDSFAGVRNFNVGFKDGVNVVYGRNEAGKSTLVNLISRTLFQNARIDGRSDKSFRDSFFPAQRKGSTAAGDSIDGSVTISHGEDTYKLTKEWGADPRCKLTTPDGNITGQDSVNDRLRELMQYGEGVYNELLLSSQHNTDAALETLMNAKDKSATRQEIVDAVSAAFAESGGASLDAIENAIKGKIAEIEGAHWDAERNAPKKKADRWKSGVGTILKAYYDIEDAQKTVSSLNELEQNVTDAMQKYEVACAAVEEAEAAYNRFNAFAGALAARRDRAKIIKRLEDDVEKYAAILKEWPKLAKQLDAARVLKAEKAASELKSKYEKVKTIASELDALKSRAASAKSPSEDELAAVKTAQRTITRLENKLCGMNLNAAITMLNGHSVELRSLRTGEALIVEDGSAAITEAVAITVPGVMELRLTPADVDVEDVERQLAEKREKIAAVFEKYGVDSLEAMETMAADADTLARDAEDKERQLSLALDGEELSALEEKAKELPETLRAPEDISGDIFALCGSSDVDRFITAKETTLGQYANEYGSVDAMRVKSVAAESELERARAESAAAEDVPEEYMNISDPADYLERLQQTQRDARSHQSKALSEKSAAEARLEDFRDEMTEDPNEAVYNAEHRFAEQKELLTHWKHIDSVFAEHRAALSSSPMSDIAERFAQNLELISGGRDAAELPNGNKLDFNVYSADRLVDYGKLSEGTKDTVSLAFRLAVLDHLFPDGGGVIVLDDPCTDMDEERAARSCELIQKYAGRHQVIFLTCREEYADSLGGNLIRL